MSSQTSLDKWNTTQINPNDINNNSQPIGNPTEYANQVHLTTNSHIGTAKPEDKPEHIF